MVSEATSQLTDLEPPSEAVKIHCFRPAGNDVITSSCFGGAAPIRSSSLSPPPPCNGGLSGGRRFVWRFAARGREQSIQTATSTGRKLAAEKSVPGTGGTAEMETIKSSPHGRRNFQDTNPLMSSLLVTLFRVVKQSGQKQSVKLYS